MKEGHGLSFDVCLFVASVLLFHVEPHIITVICAPAACLLVWPGRVSSCTPVSVPLFAYGLMFGSCMLSLYLSLSVPPCTVTCSSFLLIVLPPRQARESGAGARRKSSSLVFALRWKANSEMHKHRKCCFPHAGSSWASVALLALSEIGNVSAVSACTCLSRPLCLLRLAKSTCPLHCRQLPFFFIILFLFI